MRSSSRGLSRSATSSTIWRWRRKPAAWTSFPRAASPESSLPRYALRTGRKTTAIGRPSTRGDMPHPTTAFVLYWRSMPSCYLPIFIFIAIAVLFPSVTIVIAKLIRPSAPSLIKLEAYECGIKAASDSRGRYTVRFYIIAILFVIFDVETIFLFPWAVRYKALGWFGVAEMMVFLAILVVGYVWAYKKGALEWV